MDTFDRLLSDLQAYGYPAPAEPDVSEEVGRG